MLWFSRGTQQKFDDAISRARSPWRRILICGIPGLAAGVYGVKKAYEQDPHAFASRKVIFFAIGAIGGTVLGMVGGAILELMDRFIAKGGEVGGASRAGAFLLFLIIVAVLLVAVFLGVGLIMSPS